MHLHDLTIKKLHDGLVEKKFTALEVTEAYYKWIEEKNPEIGAYLSTNKESAYLQAEKTDLAVAKEKPVEMLAGVPLAVKDNILIEGQPATAASNILKNYVAAYDATVITKLRAAGAVFLGKTNMDEFAMGSSTENSAFQTTKNPHDPTRVPGGSSGGSAAAVASHMALAALGSDTGGSIRQPAAFCQVVGLKPTYGAVSRYGLIAMASSLDQIGPLARTVEDAAWLFQAIRGQDSFDATSIGRIYREELLHPTLERVKSLTIGLPEEYFAEGLDAQIAARIDTAIAHLKSLGLRMKKISLPHTKYAVSVYYIIMPAEVSANLARFEGIRYAPVDGVERSAHSLKELYVKNRSLGFGAEAKRRVILGTFVLSSGYYDAYYAKAQKVRTLIAQDFERAFKTVDVIVTPVTPTPPFKIGEKVDDPLQMYLSDIYTIPVNLAGLPALAMPSGVQLIGRHWGEADILGVGHFYEQISASQQP